MPAGLRGVFNLIACAARHWSIDNASTTGAALAFYCAFSLAPLLVILLTLAGLVVGIRRSLLRMAPPLPSRRCCYGSTARRRFFCLERSSPRASRACGTTLGTTSERTASGANSHHSTAKPFSVWRTT